ncbi:acyl-ACP desaturase [Nocardia cyriacigeorgica]|uniref:acyl-ACP desaturase n=1 Tax=Nocardia cyriacigeorgica TaxID=135487 RepID=UPI0028120789|nr:acyl-ACP desaturase [Nocardia cyriacigeorgica]
MTTALTDRDILRELAPIAERQLACHEPIVERMLQRIAADENLHMIFYRTISGAALDFAPDDMVRAITDVVTRFQMTGLTQPDFRRNSVVLAKNQIFHLRQHVDVVVRPVLRATRFEERCEAAAAHRAERTAAAG